MLPFDVHYTTKSSRSTLSTYEEYNKNIKIFRIFSISLVPSFEISIGLEKKNAKYLCLLKTNICQALPNFGLVCLGLR